MAWTDYPVAAGTDIQDRSSGSVLQILVNAISERRQARGASSVSVPSVGDDIQLASYWAGLQSDTTGLAGGYTDSSAGTPTPGSDWPDDYTTATLLAAAGVHADGFIRKRPREIDNLSSPVDTEGNTCSLNDVAWWVGAGFKGLYICISTGAAPNWARCSPRTCVPDTLSSDGAVGSQVASYGNCQIGDYIGAWLFNEMRDVLMQLRWTDAQTAWSALTTKRGNGSDTFWDDLGGNGAKPDAIADYQTVTPSIAHIFQETTGDTNPPFLDFYDAKAEAATAETELTGIYTGVVHAAACYGDAFAEPSANAVFDDNGLGWTEDEWNELYSAGAAATATRSTGTLGSVTIPVWCDEPTDISGEWRGWIMQASPRWLLDWTFTDP